MTRPIRNRILKDSNGGDISDHLRNHIHLTNCIHLKNHMHKQSPILAERSLVRDLIVLQRSRSLRDPSASPRSFRSHSVVDVLPKTGDIASIIEEGRRSIGIDRRRVHGRRLSGSSPPLVTSFTSSKVAPGEIKRRTRRQEEEQGEELRMKSDQNRVLSGRSSKRKGKHVQDDLPKTLSDKLNEVVMDSDDVASSNIQFRPRHSRRKTFDEPETSLRGLSKVKRRKFQGGRRNKNRASLTSRDIRSQNELSVASNSLPQGSAHGKFNNNPEEEEEEEEDEERNYQNVHRGPKNVCGLPWNWSIIHNRGKSILDKAGRSLSCGLSDSKLRRGGTGTSDLPAVASDFSSSSAKSEGDALPLLVDPLGSQESTDNNGGWAREYSGELGIYAENLFKREVDSDLASEARSGDRRKLRGHNLNNRHQNLTQKYMPKTFRDLVGQNLVAQALSNAVVKKKVGLLYVFYGPHGTGKSAGARIFARALNCISLEHQKPCGFCNSCISHDMGKSRNIKEVGPVGNFNFKNIREFLDKAVVSKNQSQYRVFIFDDCDSLALDCWSTILKVIDRAPRRVVFILVSSSLDVLPHIIISRCQKFFFPKLKDADIIYTLQWVATKEDIEIDKDALKLIASRSDGSLRDAEMTLEQLSLLSQRISVPLVQELVGLVSDEKLVDLLDLALSADTVNTVKHLRIIMETGVEPLSLMSQLATVITDILAGSYDFTKERARRKFFRHQSLSKEDMEKLRQALKTLSEAEKQLRTSNDKLTWLTAALLQLAPDQQFMLLSSVGPSSNHSPIAPNNSNGRGIIARKSSENGKGVGLQDRKRHMVQNDKEIQEIWFKVLEKIPIKGLKEFLNQEGKLISVSFGAAPTAQLLFTSDLTKSTAEKFNEQILRAFESVLGPSVRIEIRCESIRDTPETDFLGKGEIVELADSPPPSREANKGVSELIIDNHEKSTRSLEEGSRKKLNMGSVRETGKVRELSKSQSIVRSKVSLAHVLQQAEGCSQRSEWSRHRAMSIAEKLEQENLRLEPQSRSLLCCKSTRATRRKISHWRIRTRRSHSLKKLISCGRCLSAKSPRSR